MRIQRTEGKQRRPDEAARYELPHLHLHCLQIQPVFIFGVLIFKCLSKLIYGFTGFIFSVEASEREKRLASGSKGDSDDESRES